MTGGVGGGGWVGKGVGSMVVESPGDGWPYRRCRRFRVHCLLASCFDGGGDGDGD